MSSTDGDLVGCVVVVAGRHSALAPLAARLAAVGALVAFVSDDRLDGVHASVRADPADPEVWERVAPHVEQRLGPVDVVVADAGTVTVLDRVFAADLRRRGHGAVLTAPVDATVDDLLSLVRRTR